MTRMVAVLLLAWALALPSFAEEPGVTRDTYDDYVGVFTMRQHVDSCGRRAPAALQGFSSDVAAFRAASEATLRRLEPAARKWRLPGDRPLDEVLAHIEASTDAYYADAPDEVAFFRCAKLLATLASHS